MLMQELLLIGRKEFRQLFAGDRGNLVVFLVLIFFWSILLSNLGGAEEWEAGVPVWWLFLAVVISGNFAHSTFTLERMNGNLEILMTCGLSRPAVLYGKILYIVISAIFLGGLCVALSRVMRLLPISPAKANEINLVWGMIAFIGAAFMNAALGAWISVRFANPRIVYFISMLCMGAVVAVYYSAVFFLNVVNALVLPSICVIGGVLFCFLAQRAFNGEKVIQPVCY